MKIVSFKEKVPKALKIPQLV